MGRLDYNMSDKSRLSFDVRHNNLLATKNNYFKNIATGTITNRRELGRQPRRSLHGQRHQHSEPAGELHVDQREQLGPQRRLQSDLDYGFPSYFAANSDAPGAALHVLQHQHGLREPGHEWRVQASFAVVAAFRHLDAGAGHPHVEDRLRRTAIPAEHDHLRGVLGRLQLRQQQLGARLEQRFVARWRWARTWRSSCSACRTRVSTTSTRPGSWYAYYVSGFVQDDWRVKSNLTVNFGLRFDHNGPYNEKYGRTVDGFATNTQNPIGPAAIAAYALHPAAMLPASALRGERRTDLSDQRQHGGVQQDTSHLCEPARGRGLDAGKDARQDRDPRRLRHVRLAQRPSPTWRRTATTPRIRISTRKDSARRPP